MIISINSHKGGVGKSTLALVLPYYLRNYFKNILMIDFDPQANLTRRITGKITKDQSLKNIFEFLIDNDIKEEKNLEKLNELFNSINIFILFNKEFSVNILGSELALSGIMKKMYDQSTIMVFRVIDFIKHISKQFDLVIIDTPPSTDLLTFSAIAASDYYIIPITADVDAVSGAFDIVNKLIPNVKNYFNAEIKLLGTVINMSEERTNVDKTTTSFIQQSFGGSLFNTKISRTTKIREMNLSFESTIENLKNTKVDEELVALSKEIMERIEKWTEKKS